MTLSTIQSLSQTPEAVVTPQIPNGYRFHPNDQELIPFYLYQRIANPDLFTAIDIPVRDCHLFGDHAMEPWQIWDSFPKRSGEDLFFFTQLTKKGRNFTRKIRGGPSTWHQEIKEPTFSVSIDHDHKVEAVKKVFSYKNPKSDQNGSWLMYEYSLPTLSQHVVLCQLRKKEILTTETEQTTKTTTTGAKKRKRDADGVNDATNTKLGKPRVEEEDCHQQQIIQGFNGTAETVSQLEYQQQQQHLEIQSVFDSGVQHENFDSFHCEPLTVQDYLMDTVSDVTSTRNAAATEDDDFHREMVGYLYSTGFFDEEYGVPAAQVTAESSAYWVQATPTLDGSCVVDYHLENAVSTLSHSNWSDGARTLHA